MYAYQLHNMQAVADAHGWTRFSSMQNHYNLLYREDEREMIPVCHQYGMSLIPYSPLARPGDAPLPGSTTERVTLAGQEDGSQR
jgi:possible dehydrogenase